VKIADAFGIASLALPLAFAGGVAVGQDRQRSDRFAIDSTRAADSVQVVRVGLWRPYLSDSLEAERIGASARR
jgi:hypothetical protein